MENIYCHLPFSFKINWREKQLYCLIFFFKLNYCHVLIISRSAQNGEVEGVQTSKKILYSKCALVIAAGAWSGSLMQSLVKDSDIVLDVPVKPRKVWFYKFNWSMAFYSKLHVSPLHSNILLKKSRVKLWVGLGNFQPCILVILLALFMAELGEKTWTLNGLHWKDVLIIP